MNSQLLTVSQPVPQACSKCLKCFLEHLSKNYNYSRTPKFNIPNTGIHYCCLNYFTGFALVNHNNLHSFSFFFPNATLILRKKLYAEKKKKFTFTARLMHMLNSYLSV